MSNPYDEVPLIVEAGVFNAIVEIPTGSPIKYEHDKDTGLFFLDRVHYSSFMTLPMDYGYFPHTLADDGDPLDVMILSSYPIAMGVVVPVEILGYMEMVDGGDPDEKVIAKVAEDMMFENIKTLDDVNTHLRAQVEQYFKNYKQLKGKTVEIGAWHGKEEALDLIDRFQKQYQKKQGK